MMKSQKGITLVALVITIIVMLILVGVTITFALNSDLFGKAETAVTETKEQQINEAITLAKAEILANYYDGTDRVAPTEAEAEAEVEEYFDGNVGTPTVANNVYTFTVDGKTYTLDLSGASWATN